jgi:hypothetical protein
MQELSTHCESVWIDLAIDPIAYHRMPYERQMDADLVCPAGLDFDVE